MTTSRWSRAGRKGKRPRVLLVMHQLSRTGAPILALRVFRALGADVILRTLALDGGPLERDFSRLGQAKVLSSYPRLLPGRLGARARSQVGKVFGYGRMPIEGWLSRRWNPDVVVANSVWSLPILERLGQSRCPILLYVHESSVALNVFEAAHPDMVKSLPNAYIAVSSVVARDLQARYGIPRASIHVVPPFVDVPPDHVPEARAQGAPFVVGGMGYPNWTKGCDLWLLAARELVDRLGNGAVCFKWVGIPDNQEGIQFRAMVDKLDLRQVVELVDHTSEPLRCLRTFDVLALTSWEESASLVVLDAMAVGVPVVYFRGVGGPEELMPNGVVVDGFSPVAMAEAIAGVIEDPLRRKVLASVGRDRANLVYSRKNVLPSILDEIRRLAGLRSDLAKETTARR